MLLTLPPELITPHRPPPRHPPTQSRPARCLAPAARHMPPPLPAARRNRTFWARVARAKFSFADEEEAAYVPYEGYPYVGLEDYPSDDHTEGERQHHSVHCLFASHAVRRPQGHPRGRPLGPWTSGMGRDLIGLRWIWHWGGIRCHLGPDTFASSLSRAGKNRRQLMWANARYFALRYVRERLYLGRYGDLDPDAADSSSDSALKAHAPEVVTEYRQEWKEPAWRVGWPRDAEATAAALWVLWFFESDETLRAEPEHLRRLLMNLFRPLVAAPFRYASALAPPHHYSVPLLPSVFTSSAFESPGRGARRDNDPNEPRGVSDLCVGCADDAFRADFRPSRFVKTPLILESSEVEVALALAVATPFLKPPPPFLKTPRPLDRRYDGTHARSRILAAPPARLLFFARMQVGARMGVPPHLPRNREEAASKWRAAGNMGPMPICPTQEDVHEKNARPLVRFERGLLPPSAASSSAAGPSTNAGDLMTPTLAPALTSAETLDLLAVDPELDLDDHGFGPARTRRRDERWAPYRWRAQLCRGYGDERVEARRGSGRRTRSARTMPTATPATAATTTTASTSTSTAGQHLHQHLHQGQHHAKAKAAPHRDGSGACTDWGSLAGLWSGIMLMPPEQPYNALVATPNGALPPGGLRDEFVAARPVYMRIREHWSFHPDTPAPPHPADSTTADEGLRHGWFPGSPTASRGRRGPETAYTYHTPLDPRVEGAAAGHAAHDVDKCSGCVRARERERWRREVAAAADEDVDMEEEEESSSLPAESASPSATSASEDDNDNASFSQDRTSGAPWPEWDAPAWKAHGFDGDEGWEWHCDGVQDVIFEGETDTRHGMAWHHYEYVGRVRPWDGLIGLIMRPRDRTLGLSTFFISGFLVGRDTFEGTWQMAGQDVLAPSWGGSICLARGED
ncbi:hypothetical protein MSAN_02257000 [Mycena sanguinolenta]|uniref:Uncharacterized protein n=1 Tax=Mycena sanguinolenta TaxID=230812 RepID=A0A8H7CIL5_9AGAR|nr:hypothetical protein MSAN_02257000 [Mycena sanguinolenta]